MQTLRQTLSQSNFWRQQLLRSRTALHDPIDRHAANVQATSTARVEAGGRIYAIEHSACTKPRSLHDCLGLGERLYDCEIALAQHISERCNPDMLRGKRCIEVGAGLGLASFVGKRCCLLPVLTDEMDQLVLAGVKRCTSLMVMPRYCRP